MHRVLTSVSGKEKVWICLIYVSIGSCMCIFHVAFDAVSPPSSPPSLCMRLKNMFDSTMLVCVGNCISTAQHMYLLFVTLCVVLGNIHCHSMVINITRIIYSDSTCGMGCGRT